MAHIIYKSDTPFILILKWAKLVEKISYTSKALIFFYFNFDCVSFVVIINNYFIRILEFVKVSTKWYKNIKLCWCFFIFN